MIAYGIFWNIVFILIGICAYLADWKYGVKLHSRWHNLTHSEAERIIAEDPAGFIYKQPIKRKLLVATIICFLQSLASVKYAPVNALFELLSSPIEIMMILLGFYLAPGAYRHWINKDDLFEWAEGVGSGQFNFRQWFQELISGLPFVNWLRREKKGAAAEPEIKTASPTEAAPPEEAAPEKSPDQIIKDFNRTYGGSS